MSIESIVYDDSNLITNKMLECSMQKQSVIANNLANLETPGYVRRILDFEKTLAAMVKSGNIKEISNLEPKVIHDPESGPGRLDGNNVSKTDELNEMMQNSILYGLLTKAYSTKMSILRAAITGGG